MPLPQHINNLLQATRTITLQQALALDEAYWVTLNDYELLERVDYIAKWFDYWEDWNPLFLEALDIAEKQDWTYETGSEEALGNASHVIRLALQAMIFERYLKPEEFTAATKPALDVLG